MSAVLQHTSVLLEEAIHGLVTDVDGVYVDGTFGRGGHTAALLECLGPKANVIAFDKDPEAILHAQTNKRFQDERLTIVPGSFTQLADAIEQRGLLAQVSGVLLDLGVSSPQLASAVRGFSFQEEGPLDMRMDTTSYPDAASWLSSASESEIQSVLFEYGETRMARRIARRIVQERVQKPILSTKDLANLVIRCMPKTKKTHWKRHPATKTFQAIRIFINRELDELKQVLTQCQRVLRSSGRLAVISFHSLEDRIVKRFIQGRAMGDSDSKEAQLHPLRVGSLEYKDLPIAQTLLSPQWKRIGRPIFPSPEEVERNPRSRSAVLRLAEKA